MKKTIAYILLILGIIMLYFGYKVGPPPAITGVGFILISMLYLKK